MDINDDILDSSTKLDNRRKEKLLAYKQMLIQSNEDKPLEVTAHQAARYTGDFYGLLLAEGITTDMLYVTAMVNGIISTDYDGLQLSFTSVNTDVYRRLNRLL